MTQDAFAAPAGQSAAPGLRGFARAELTAFAAFLRRPVRYPPATQGAGWMPRAVFFTLVLLACDVPLALLADWIGGLAGIAFRVPEGKLWAFGLLAVVFAPAFEELAFRAGLRTMPYVFFVLPALALAALLGRLFGFGYAVAALAAGAAAFAAMRRSGRQGRAALRRLFAARFRGVFWSVAALFAIIHVSNYDFLSVQLPLMPLFVLPQLAAGAVLGYLRLRDGLQSSWLVHALHNACAVGLIFLFD